MRFNYKVEYPCGLKEEVDINSLFGFSLDGSIKITSECRLHGKNCKQEKEVKNGKNN